ncbi:MAG TPA: DEAD/DEAH box helicase [Dissulfurispiraceae bacterium]|nr:DEAD/DEAH box helicase [Dissulfurispiraceae bacterium]
MKFDELNIPEAVREGIRTAGFTECTPVQALTLPHALQGKDIAAQAQTGTGKTAAFLISVFSRMLTLPYPGTGPSPRALVIAPTRELVVQICEEAQVLGGSTGFRIVPVYGGIDYNKQRNDLAQGVDMLVGTPGRLIDYLKQKIYSLRKTQFLVIDEADRMFDMGFIADLRFLLKRMAPYSQRQSMLFSATLSHRVMELAYEYMNMPERYEVTPEQVTVERVEQLIYHVGKEEKFGLLLWLVRQDPGGRYLVFCNMKVTAEKLQRHLEANGIKAEAITGDVPQKKRLRVLAGFKEGLFPVLIASDVASRGIHIDDVTHVINYDLPQDPQDYVHRIGRTGRAGAGGAAITLACENYILALPEIEAYIKQKIPVGSLTDEMIVTDYKRAPRGHAKPLHAERRRPERKERSPRKRSGPRTERSAAAGPGPQTPANAGGESVKKRKRRRRRGKPDSGGQQTVQPGPNAE